MTWHSPANIVINVTSIKSRGNYRGYGPTTQLQGTWLPVSILKTLCHQRKKKKKQVKEKQKDYFGVFFLSINFIYSLAIGL